MLVDVDVTYMHTNFGGCGLSGFGDKISLWSIKVEKFHRSESAQKIHASRGQCHVHVHQFWWAWSLRFRRYGYLSKTAKFPFRPMDYSPWSSKISIDRNRLKKFMQVGMDVKCMHTNFGGRGLSGFGDKISLWSIKVEKLHRSESAQKIHASRGQCHVHVHQFWWAWSLRFRRYGYLSKTAKFPFRPMDYSPWSSKISIDRNRLKKFMQVGMDVKCMHTNFGGRGLSGFGDKISLWSIKVEKLHRSESAQKIHASRGQCHVHVHQFWWAWSLRFRRYGYLSKTAKFPFRPMDYSPWSSKISIDRNRLKKFMQVGMDVKCMHTNFGGRGLSGFGDKISLWSIKVEKLHRSESAQKIHASRGQCHVHVHQFWWAWSLRFRRYGYLSKTAKFPFRPMDYSPWSSKISIDRNRLKKFMQVGMDVKCMHTNFGGRGLSGFGDKISLWSIKVEKLHRSESAQKIHASRGQCHVHVHQFWWAWSLRFRRYGYLSKTAKFPFRPMDYSPWSSKISIDRNRLKKFMQVGMDVKCMHTNFGGRGLSGFGDKISLWSIKVEKLHRSESAQKIHASRGQCHVHVHQFWWAWSLRFRRYGYLSKTAKFPFRPMDYSPWSSKISIDRNRLKKFMQVGMDVKCMHTNFGGRGLSGFGDKISLWSIKVEKLHRSESAQKIHASRGQCHVHVHQFWWAWSLRFRRYGYLSKTAKFPFRPMDYSPWSSKISIDRNRLKKFMQVGMDVKCMHTNFGGRGLSGFGDKISLWSIKVEKLHRSESAQKIHASRGQCHVHVHQFWWAWSLRFRRYGYLSKTAKFPFRPMDYSPWSSKISIDRNRLKKFMQVGMDVKCMHTNFGGRGLSGFGDKISLWSIKVEKLHRSKSAQKIHASRGQCHVHVHQFWWAWSLRFRRYGYLSKTAKFPFRPMDYSPWSSKISIDRNRLKKFMQVGMDVKCMHTNFGGRGLSGFGDKISLWSIKVEKLHRSESAQKIHASRGQCHVHVHQFWWAWSLRFRRYGYLSKTAKFPFRPMDYSPWSSKISIDRNRLKKFMQVGMDVKCMHTNFGGRGLSGFGDKISLWSIKVEKLHRSESAQKIHASRGQCHVHVHQFWWAWSLRFRRYGYLSKTAKFPFRPMDYSPWSSKISIDRNRLKKFMQVGMDVKCMHTNFGGRGLSGFGDKISLWSIKVEKLHRSESAQKIHASRGQCHVHVHQFWWAWSLRFRRYGYLSKTAKFPFRPMDYSPWSSKISIDRNRLKKFMQVGMDVKCMHTNFGGRGLSGFGDKISLWSIKVEKFHRSESAQKIHASRGQCHVHVHQFWWAWSLRFPRYGYLSKMAKFPFRPMDYSPWSSKNSIA